jgi:hypothetical protein
MQSRTIELLCKQGNPIRLLVSGDMQCKHRSTIFSDELQLWEVCMQVGWYSIECYIELGPMGDFLPAGSTPWTWMDTDTADLVTSLRIKEQWAATDMIFECALNALIEDSALAV